MKNLLFKRLVLVSDTTKSANQFEFQNRFNLITGKNNSIGKSTLAKSLFWALGCAPDFDENWNSLNCKAILYFSILGTDYVVMRTNTTMVLGNKNGELVRYFGINGEYSEAFSKLVSFKAKLPNRNDANGLETPPPAYYFLPF